jgi:outer membrane protein OmpA-like peptidoglycan-associated protein
MAESLFASLLHSLDKSNLAQIASSLGESEQSTSRGMESSIACILGAIISKAHDPGALRSTLDLIPDSFGDVSWPKLATSLATPGSQWLTKGKEVVSGLFGSNDVAVANALSRETGVTARTATTMLTLGAPMVLRFLARKVYDNGLSMKELGAMLQREAPTIRSALPAGLSDLFWPHGVAATAASPVIAQSVHRERSSAGWVTALALAALALGGLWLWMHGRKPVTNLGTATLGEANRLADGAAELGRSAKPKLPSVDLNLPALGVESKLLDVIKGTSAVDQKTWLDFDALMFDSGSATLRPESSEQVDNIAAILKAYPNTHLMLGGFADNTGSAESNLALSRERAESVKSALVSRGIASDRLTTRGFGEDAAWGDNSTDAERAANRRVCLQVTQK